MRLIKRVEVNYLRSLYSLSLDDVGDLNVVFGRNDSGKPNLLRALNLFFNDETDVGHDFDFAIEISDQRKKVAREAKGRQFIWIKITFNVPTNYQSALGTEIAIKRQWNRDGDMNETVFPPLESSSKQSRLTRFLNDIDFTYIPAIKDLNVYADLIERMYGAAADTGALKDATDAFVSAIGERTEKLSEQLAALFGTPARLAPPTEMKRLFRNLDFAHGEDRHSLLRQKGDGIKARHLPELLRFINEVEDRSKLFIWGFEEPENSLDLNAAELEAARFCNFANRSDTQVFITSHSPAFYLSESVSHTDTEVKRFFIVKQEPDPDGAMQPSNAAARIDQLEDAELRMSNAGLLQLPFVIRRMKEQREELEQHRAEAGRLRKELSELRRPTLFTEGAHDVAMFTSSFARLGSTETVVVKPLGGTPQSADTLINAVLDQGGLSANAPTVFLFDNDRPGRSAFSKLCKQANRSSPARLSEHQSVWCIPMTDEFKDFLRRHKISDDQAFFTAEFLYPAEASAALCAELLERQQGPEKDIWLKTISGQYFPSVGQPKCLELAASPVGSIDWFFARGVPDFIKTKFSKEVAARNFSSEHIDEIARKVIELMEIK